MAELTGEQFDQLLAAYLDGALDPADVEQLNTALRADASRRELFVESCLQMRLAAERGSSHEKAVRLREPILPSPPRLVKQYAAAAAIVLACGLLIAWMSHWPTPHPDDHSVAVAPPAPLPIAVVTYTENVNWSAKSVPYVAGSELQPTTLTLDSGLAEISCLSGADLIVEGPAELTLDSSMHARLTRGKLTAYVPPQSVGFTVDTPSVRLIDRGTAFGVVAGADSNVEVFEGRVDAESTDHAGGGEMVTHQMVAGDTARITLSGKFVTTGDHPTTHFIRDLEGRRLGVTPQYIQAVRSLSPIAYWRFEHIKDGETPDKIDPTHTAKMIGKVTLLGPPGDRAVVFRPNRSDQYLYTTQRLKGLVGRDYTVELWAMPEWPQRGMLIELVKNMGFPDRPNRQMHEFLIELEKNSTVRFMHRIPAGISGGTDLYSDAPCTPGKWHHIVAVKKGSVMTLYLDGQVVGTDTDASSFNIDPYVTFGKLTDSGKVRNERRYFIGRLDEVAVYNHALTAQQVREHYQLIHHP